jgi:subtilisin family serine protease
MKNIFTHLTTLLLIGCLFTTATAQKAPDKKKFYYAFKEKIFIEEVPDKFVVKFKSASKAAAQQSQLQKSLQNRVRYQDETSVRIDITSTGGNINTLLKDRMADVEVIKPVYKYQQQEMSYTNEILVEPNDGVKIQQVIERTGFSNYAKIKEGKFYSVIEVAPVYDACEVANKIQESGLVKYSHPNFAAPITRFQVIPNDTYFNNQYYLRNTGQVFNPVENHAGLPNADINASFAWNTTLGNNAIIVAVLDEGVTPDHPDLPNTRQIRLNGSNFLPGENANDPSPTGNGNHGNSCAGIIGATQNNNEGISGVAPNVRIMPIKILNSQTGAGADFNGTAAAIDLAWQNGAHVISNSWGYENMTNPNFSPAIVNAINRAVTQGRNGLGSVVVFAASNTATHANGVDGTISFPSNVTINGVLTVGASDRDDLQSDYSPISNAASPNNQIIDIVAPSERARPQDIPGETGEIWTIDIPGNNGYNPWPAFTIIPVFGEVLPAAGPNNLAYTGRFGGTSAACPQVAAVAALLLSVNSGLTQQQIFDLITQSADDVGGYFYNANGWSAELGNGRLNACAALSRIPNRFDISGVDVLCSGSTTLNIPGLPTGSTVIWQSSNTNVATIDPGGVVSRVGNNRGIVTFTATINPGNRCGNIVSTIPIGVGVPDRPMSFDENGNPVTTIQLCAGTATTICTDVDPRWGILEYEWEKGTGDFDMVGFGNCAAVSAFLPGSGFISVRARNACGFSIRTLFVIQVLDCNTITAQQNSFKLYPNPASGSVTISIDKKNNAISNAKGDQNPTVLINEVKIYDNFGMLKFYRKYNKQQTATMDISGLEKGVYTVVVNTGNGVERQKLLIQK